MTNCTFSSCLAGQEILFFHQDVREKKVSGNSEQNCAKVTGLIVNNKTLDTAQWKQRTFENTLGWDFDHVWQWDTQKNHPVLRLESLTKATTAQPATAQANMTDLLTQQIRANIWL